VSVGNIVICVSLPAGGEPLESDATAQRRNICALAPATSAHLPPQTCVRSRGGAEPQAADLSSSMSECG
jgi:hypothetical protein